MFDHIQGSRAGRIQSFEIIYSFIIYRKKIDILLNNYFFIYFVIDAYIHLSVSIQGIFQTGISNKSSLYIKCCLEPILSVQFTLLNLLN